jgi:hypothetical protein
MKGRRRDQSRDQWRSWMAGGLDRGGIHAMEGPGLARSARMLQAGRMLGSRAT